MELKDTVDMMLNDDYKERFRAEYYQTKIRFDKLVNMLEHWNSGELNFKPTCSKRVFERQARAMKEYLELLEERAEIEKLKLRLDKLNKV